MLRRDVKIFTPPKIVGNGGVCGAGFFFFFGGGGLGWVTIEITKAMGINPRAAITVPLPFLPPIFKWR